MTEIIETRRVTSQFLAAIPPQVSYFDAYLYAVVARKPNKIIPGPWGKDVRLDPCTLDWEHQAITVRIPFNINHGIESIDDLDPHFFEAVQASFLALMHSCLP